MKTAAPLATFLAATAFALVTLVGIAYAPMPMEGGKAAPCPFMPGMTLCPMSALDHVALAQTNLASLPGWPGAALLLFSLALIAVAILSIQKLLVRLPSDPAPPAGATQYFLRQVPVTTVLERLFSAGILNPKPF